MIINFLSLAFMSELIAAIFDRQVVGLNLYQL